MLVQIVSDLHLEFNEAPQIKNTGADVLVLGGDICVAEHLYRNPTAGISDLIQNGFYAKDAIRYREFLQYCSENWNSVIYLAGNHEYYGGRWDRTIDILREETERYHNVLFCDQDHVDFGDVVFLGCTLWTNFNGGDPLTLNSARDFMNDYRNITEQSNGNYHKLRPITTFAKHTSDLDWLRTQLSLLKDRRVVVCTHHQPSFSSVHEKYASQHIMNGMFCSNLDEFILDHPQIALWTCGHVHNNFDYKIGDTRIVVNPRGYPGEVTGFNPQLVVEV